MLTDGGRGLAPSRGLGLGDLAPHLERARAGGGSGGDSLLGIGAPGGWSLPARR